MHTAKSPSNLLVTAPAATAGFGFTMAAAFLPLLAVGAVLALPFALLGGLFLLRR